LLDNRPRGLPNKDNANSAISNLQSAAAHRPSLGVVVVAMSKAITLAQIPIERLQLVKTDKWASLGKDPLSPLDECA
jgi:hypothetical protein